jgi:peptide deformylase
MIRPIVRDEMFLAVPSVKATAEDLKTAADLEDTLNAHRDHCAGMAANMIGVRKNIIAVALPVGTLVMFNPVITRKSGRYTAFEGCLSLTGERSAERWQKITVRYQTKAMKTMETEFSGFIAQTIQHEIDHCRGIII